jgi:hypothetical protein
MPDNPQAAPITATAPPVAPIIAPLLIDAAGAAALADVSRAVWFRWQSAGFCPAAVLRRGRVVRWSVDELTAWIAAGCPARDRWNVLRGPRK